MTVSHKPLCTEPRALALPGLGRGRVGLHSRCLLIGEPGEAGNTHTTFPAAIMAGAFVVLVLVVLFASVELDREGVRGALVGAGLGLVNLVVGYVVLRRALRQSMKEALMLVVGGMIARLFLVAGLMILFQRTGAADPTAFALTFLVFFFVYLGLEVLLVERSLK